MPSRDKARRNAQARARAMARSALYVCELEGCEKHVDGTRRVCPMHYQRMKHHGSYDQLVRVYPPKKVKEPKPKPKRVAYCVMCAAEYEPVGPQLTCSSTCARARKQALDRAYNVQRPRKARPVLRVSCAGCSIVFETSNPNKRYHDGHCGERKTEQGEARRRAGNKMRRMRLRLWARDRVCYLCGQGIDYALSYPHPLSPQTDHLTPLSMGGATTLDNLAVVHMQCNLAKGDDVAMWWQRDALVALRTTGGTPFACLRNSPANPRPGSHPYQAGTPR